MKSKTISLSALFLSLLLWLLFLFPLTSSAETCGNTTTIQVGTNGPGYQTTPNQEEEEVPATLPDFVVKKVILTATNGNEKYQFHKNEEIKIKVLLKNIGDDGIGGDDNIETRYYLSKGYKEDSHNQWRRVGKDNTKGRNLQPNETHWEQEGLKLWNQDIIKKGKIYNIVVCVDRTQDQHNGDGDYSEIYESNNCSTEAVFEVLGDNQPPTGFLDSVNCNQFTGWAKDPNTIGSISVHFYIDGEAGTGTYIGGVTANQHRGDLPFDDKNHGFTFRTPASIKDGHQHHIYAYGIDEQNQVNSLLNNSPLTINHCISPAVMQVIRGFYLESE